MPKQIQIPDTLYRTMSVREVSPESDEIELSFSSEDPVERYFGYEILGHGPDEVDLTRLSSAGPLLFNHDPDRHIGRVVSARVDGGRGKAVVKFSNSPLGREKLQDVRDGILQEVSVGYRVMDMVLVSRTSAGRETYRVTKWQPLEISMVTVPADTTVGVGRSHATNTITIMSENTTPAPVDFAAERDKIRRDELKRIAEIRKVADEFGKRGFRFDNDLVRRAESDGLTADSFARSLIENHPEVRVAHEDPNKILGEAQAQEKRTFSICRVLSAMLGNRQVDGFEGEVIRAVAKHQHRDADGLSIPSAVFGFGLRAMEAGTASTGGYGVDTELQSLVEKLDNQPVIQQAGATMLTGLVGNLAFPRQSGGASAYWVAESGSITASDLTFEQFALTPHGIGAQTVVSKQNLLQNTIALEALIRSDIQKRINLGIDKAALVGTGVNGQPKGLYNLDTSLSGINTVTFGGAPVWADIVEFETLINADNGDVGSMGFIVSPAVRGKWKATSKDTGSGMFLADQSSANGYPIYVTNQLSGGTHANYVAFGVWSTLICGMWSTIDLTMNPYSLDSTGQVRITALGHADIGFRYPESFAISTDAGNQS